MPIPTGAVSFSNVNTELRLTSTAQLSMSNQNFRGLAGQETGAINLLNCRGKSIVGRGNGFGSETVALSCVGFSSSSANAGNWWGGVGVCQTVINGVFTNVHSAGFAHPTRWSMLFDGSSSLGNAYQIRITQTAAFGSALTLSLIGGISLNTFTTVGTDAKQIMLSRTAAGGGGRTFTIQFRETATSVIVGQNTGVTFEAERF